MIEAPESLARYLGFVAARTGTAELDMQRSHRAALADDTSKQRAAYASLTTAESYTDALMRILDEPETERRMAAAAHLRAHGPCTCPLIPWTPHKHTYTIWNR